MAVKLKNERVISFFALLNVETFYKCRLCRDLLAAKKDPHAFGLGIFYKG